MDLQFTQEEFDFQREVRDWINSNYPEDMKKRYMNSPNGHLTKEEHMKWQQALHSKGWSGINWPKEFGGAEFTASQKYLFNKEMSAAHAPSVVGFGEKMVAPVIMAFGSTEQKKKYLPDILSSKAWWCQGYSEPSSGSDLASLKTKAEDKGDYYLVNGAKTWTTLAQYADMIFCLVRTSQEDIRQKGISFLLMDMHSPGIEIQPINTLDNTPLGHHEINTVFFQDVKVPKENLLPGKSGLGAPLGCLDSARYGIAWGAIGAAMDCYDTALRYAKEREQFGKPIAAYQLQQKKLAEMITEITKAQLLAFRLGQLKNEGKATTAQISMAKRNNVEMAIKIAREARQVLGGMGITGEYSIMRHMMNLESVITYEGTHDIHLLITGADITGIPAFK